MKVIQTILNLFFLAGALLLLILLVLSGSTASSPINKIYWLRADTSSIPNAYSQSQWAFWSVCDTSNLKTCHTGPAYPLSPQDNFGTNDVPQDFVDNRSVYYYLSKFAFAFGIIALALAGITFVISLLGFCFGIIDKVTAFLITLALFFVAGFAAFQTAVVVLAKKAFSDADKYAKIPTISMALLWTAVACLAIVWFNTIGATISQSWKKHMNNVNDNQHNVYDQPNQQVPLNDQSSFTREAPVKEDTSGGIRFFKIKRNQKSVIDDESV